MKHTIEMIREGEDEVVIRCREITPAVQRILDALQNPAARLIGTVDDQQHVIDLTRILYIESVDGRTFVYTADAVLQVEHTLAQLETLLDGVRFFRCSKSMILNIDRVKALKSLACNRIDATMQGGEHIIISRIGNIVKRPGRKAAN